MSNPKNQLQKEILEKVKEGVKPSDLKRKVTISNPSEKPILKVKEDEGYESDKSNKSIPKAPPLPNSQISALQKKIEIQEAIKKADEKIKRELTEKVSKLETKLQTIINLAGKEKTEYQQTINNLQQKITDQYKTIADLQNQVKNKGEVKESVNKTFFCDSCQLTKTGTYTKRKVDSPFEPRLHRRACYLCSFCSPYLKELNDTDYSKDNNPYKTY